MSALVQYWQGQQERIIKRIEPKVPKDRKGLSELPDVLNATFWDEEIRSLLSVLMPFIQQGAEGGVAVHAAQIEPLGIAVDWTMPYTEAADWARKYGGKLVRDVTRTTRDRVGVNVANWIESGESLPSLTRQLMTDHGFSRARAKLIAITETTASYSRGELTAARTLEKQGYFAYQKEWQTAADDVVCPICRPLQSTRVDGVNTNFDTEAGAVKGPPAHPGCRCWMNTVPMIAEEEVVTPQFETTADAEKWIKDHMNMNLVDLRGYDVRNVQELADILNEWKRNSPTMELDFIADEYTARNHMEQIIRARMESLYRMRAEAEGWTAERLERELASHIKETMPPRLYNAYAAIQPYIRENGSLGNGLMLNAGWMNDYEKLANDITRNSESGWIPAGATRPAVVFDHELAHVFDQANSVRNSAQVHEWFNAAKDAAELPSLYSGKDIREFIAEGWIDYQYNPSPTKYGRLIGELLSSLF